MGWNNEIGVYPSVNEQRIPNWLLMSVEYKN
jgi:hypothetical protein